MVMVSLSLRENYWEEYDLTEADIEYLYNYLLETETPLTSEELVQVLIQERIRREKVALEEQRTAGGDLYRPGDKYEVGQTLIFPALGWRKGDVAEIRAGNNPDLGEFEVIRIRFGNEEEREYASKLAHHALNAPPKIAADNELLRPKYVMEEYGEDLIGILEEGLEAHSDFVQIAGRWFPRALLVDVNIGHLNLAEAVLDMQGGGPAQTGALLEQIELDSNVNPKLLEFSLDLALQEDNRFDEVGPAGKVLWFLKRLEPEPVLKTPLYLRYGEVDHDRSVLSPEMLDLERELDDELSPLRAPRQKANEITLPLIFPHWRAGTLPLASRIGHLFPTAYEAPRIQFTFVDGETGDTFPAWVVRENRYVYGLGEWYAKNELLPGSYVTIRRGRNPGEVIIANASQRSSREWVRTVLVGSDGGMVFAMLKQIVTANFDERMIIAVPDPESIDQLWERNQKNRPLFERVVVSTVRELAKLNPQSHVHAIELYAAVNIVRRCPPGPILALLASRPWFTHVGDLHYRYVESDHMD